jgi:hypothetical protein
VDDAGEEIIGHETVAPVPIVAVVSTHLTLHLSAHFAVALAQINNDCAIWTIGMSKGLIVERSGPCTEAPTQEIQDAIIRRRVLDEVVIRAVQ